MIELDGVEVRYPGTGRSPDVVAVRGVDLAIAAGEVVAVVGPSGCGKSTLLRAVAGLEPLTAGSVTVDGRNLVGVPAHQRGMGLMFQHHALFPHLDVAGNVAFGLQHLERRARADRVAEMLAVVGLAGTGARPIDQLSGGEAQRVALARALAPSPSILMLDEPLGSLDRLLRRELTVELRRLVTELGVTTIHVTHDQAEAFALADRVVVMREGEVQQIGAPAELWLAPASRFVADFLGHENLWARDGEVLLAPVNAVSLLDSEQAQSGSMLRRVRVEQIAFAEGRYRIRGRSVDDHPGETVVFETVVFETGVFETVVRPIPAIADVVTIAVPEAALVRLR